MIVVRVVQRGDVDALMRLAQETGPGLTTFKPDREALAARVERARRTMEDKAEPHEAGYFFVMEDTDTGDVAGVCGIAFGSLIIRYFRLRPRSVCLMMASASLVASACYFSVLGLGCDRQNIVGVDDVANPYNM